MDSIAGNRFLMGKLELIRTSCPVTHRRVLRQIKLLMETVAA